MTHTTPLALLSVLRLATALELIGRLDPRRYASIQLHMPRFVVIGQGTGYYWLAQRVCALGLPIIKQADAGELALVIVHEAAHARIYQAGVGWWPDLFERIESRCIKEQVAFCERMAEAGWNVETTRTYLLQQVQHPPLSPGGPYQRLLNWLRS